jgi:hypothetical protein
MLLDWIRALLAEPFGSPEPARAKQQERERQAIIERTRGYGQGGRRGDRSAAASEPGGRTLP